LRILRTSGETGGREERLEPVSGKSGITRDEK